MIEKTKHTPGPWEVDMVRDNIISADKSGHISIVGHDGGEEWFLVRVWRDSPNREANAILIAAAPDLLDVCQAALRISDLWEPLQCDDCGGCNGHGISGFS